MSNCYDPLLVLQFVVMDNDKWFQYSVMAAVRNQVNYLSHPNNLHYTIHLYSTHTTAKTTWHSMCGLYSDLNTLNCKERTGAYRVPHYPWSWNKTLTISYLTTLLERVANTDQLQTQSSYINKNNATTQIRKCSSKLHKAITWDTLYWIVSLGSGHNAALR